MPHHTRTLAALVALCLCLCGCGIIVLPGDETTAPTTTAPAPVTTAPEPVTTAIPYTAPTRPDPSDAAAEALSALPALTFDGASLIVATASETTNILFPANGESVVDAARLSRNAAVTERHKISFIPAAASVDEIFTDAAAAQNAGLYYADLLQLPASAVGRFAAAGLLRNLRNLPFWQVGDDPSATVGSAVWADLGEAMTVHETLPAVFFNRELATALEADLYAELEAGAWTWERFLTLSAATAEGIDGYAICPTDTAALCRLAADTAAVDLLNPDASVLDPLDALLRRLFGGESARVPTPDERDVAGIQAFSAGKTLFCVGELGQMAWIYDAPAAWGLLPLPSPDGVTRTPTGPTAPVLCVTANNNKFEVTGLTVAALNAASTAVVTDAYVNDHLIEHLRDWQSAGVIERIAAGRTYGVMHLYASANPAVAALAAALADAPVSGSTLTQIAQTRAPAARAVLESIAK